MVKTMFEHLTNTQLQSRVRFLLDKKLYETSSLWLEIQKDPRNTASSSGLRFLTRGDLLNLIYAFLYPEFMMIDNATAEDLPRYINYPWSMEELKTRYENKLKGEYVQDRLKKGE